MRPAPAPLPFRRHSLIEQAAQALRAAITAGTLADPLPGEHTLAEQLGISRPTLRAALALLANDGLLSVARGRRTRVHSGPTTSPPSARPAHVCIVCPQTRAQIQPGEHPILLQLHARCAAAGIPWAEHFDRRLASPRPEARLRELTRRHPRACWVLFASTAAMQGWFAAKRISCLVLGSCHADIGLPSLDLDYRATGWHAGGTLLAHGHRHIAVVLPDPLFAGDLACLKGLQAALATTPAASLQSVTVGLDPQALRTKLDRLWTQPARPTALFCLLPAHSLAVLLHLRERGRRIPGEIALLARDLPPVLAAVMPKFAHYSRPVDRFVRRTMRLIQHLLAGHAISPAPSLITPEFRLGSTLGPPSL